MNLEQYLVDATMEVFASMVFIEITAESSQAAKETPIAANLSSLIGLAGDLKGLLAIHCPAEVALGVTSSMLGLEVTELGEDVKDAIGEIANMVAGGLKIALAGHDKKIELAIPTTVIGKSFRTSGLAGATTVLVTFASPLGRLGIELRFLLSATSP